MSNYSIEKWKKERVLNLCSQYSYACMYSSDVMRKPLQSTCKVCIINRVSRDKKALKFSSQFFSLEEPLIVPVNANAG